MEKPEFPRSINVIALMEKFLIDLIKACLKMKTLTKSSNSRSPTDFLIYGEILSVRVFIIPFFLISHASASLCYRIKTVQYILSNFVVFDAIVMRAS